MIYDHSKSRNSGEAYNVRDPDYATVAFLILIAGLFCFDVFILIYEINNGIDDLHGFRQSQTALTAYWLDREPHGLAYITPVLGYPWSVPFEYPVYQWIVVLLMKVGVPLVIGGRLVSFAAFVGCLVPLKVMARDFNVSNRAFLSVAVVYLACPFYIFWSRTFMIETTALLFSLCWLAGFVQFGRSPSITLWLAALVFGILAALTKSTTFLGIGPVAGALFLTEGFHLVAQRQNSPPFPQLVGARRSLPDTACDLLCVDCSVRLVQVSKSNWFVSGFNGTIAVEFWNSCAKVHARRHYYCLARKCFRLRRIFGAIAHLAGFDQ